MYTLKINNNDSRFFYLTDTISSNEYIGYKAISFDNSTGNIEIVLLENDLIEINISEIDKINCNPAIPNYPSLNAEFVYELINSVYKNSQIENSHQNFLNNGRILDFQSKSVNNYGRDVNLSSSYIHLFAINVLDYINISNISLYVKNSSGINTVLSGIYKSGPDGFPSDLIKQFDLFTDDVSVPKELIDISFNSVLKNDIYWIGLACYAGNRISFKGAKANEINHYLHTADGAITTCGVSYTKGDNLPQFIDQNSLNASNANSAIPTILLK